MAGLSIVYDFWREMAVGSGAYPVFRQEIAHWERRVGGRWRFGEYFACLTLANLCLLPATLIFFPALLAVYALLDELLVLAVVLPASVLIVRDRQAGTWSILRTTPLSSLQLAAAKLAGLLYLGWEGASYLTGARWLGTIFALPLLGLAWLLPGSQAATSQGPSALLAAGLLAAYLLFIYRPRLNLLFGGAVGLAASSLSRSRAGAVTLSVLLAGPLMLAFGAFVFWCIHWANAGEWLGPGILAGVLARAFTWLAPMAVVTLGRAVATPLLFGLAVYRIGRLD